MKLAQQTITITVQIATKTNKFDSDGEPLYRSGSPYTLYRKSDLIEAFQKAQPNSEIKHCVDGIWGFYEISGELRDKILGNQPNILGGDWDVCD